MSGRARIVPAEVARGGPVLRAARDEPVFDGDSGWAFTGGEEVSTEGAAVWSLDDLRAREPSLAPHLGGPAGMVLTRTSPTGDWERS